MNQKTSAEIYCALRPLVAIIFVGLTVMILIVLLAPHREFRGAEYKTEDGRVIESTVLIGWSNARSPASAGSVEPTPIPQLIADGGGRGKLEP